MSSRILIPICILALTLAACTFGGLLPTTSPKSVPITTTSTPQVAHPEWSAYHDKVGGFTIRYPPDWKPLDSGDGSIIYAYDVPEGTTLGEEQLRIVVVQGATECSDPMVQAGAQSTPPQNVTFNDITFLKESGADAGVGNVYETISYSTLKGSTCIRVSFLLHSTNPMMYDTPPPDFDHATATSIFEEIMSTFRFDP
jgi:hypothetical protein